MKFHRTVLGGAEISADARTTLDREADALGVSFYVDEHVGDEDDSLGFADDAPTSIVFESMSKDLPAAVRGSHRNAMLGRLQ